jgi:hypothetical protein
MFTPYLEASIYVSGRPYTYIYVYNLLDHEKKRLKIFYEDLRGKLSEEFTAQ